MASEKPNRSLERLEDGDRDSSAESPTGDRPIAVELEDVTKRYAGTTAVDGVSLSVREGEFFTLVGPSGCGKTTTLRLIAGFESATDGAVRFHGEDVTGVPPEARDVGVVFQNYALFPHMSVGENVAYGLNFADPPGGVSDDERVRELLELVDLEGMQDREPDRLSGGQQQRVAIARALAPGPDVLLLDEPMSALDAQLRERLRIQVRAIQKELGITTVYVTHDQEEALAISDRVAVMRAGTPEQVATPQDIYRRPETRFVAEFVGDNNVFDGTVRSLDGDGLASIDVGPETFTVAPGKRDVAVGRALALCVRPENLIVAADPSDGLETENATTATVRSAEFLGETTRVHLEWHGQELLVRTRNPLSGDVLVGFDPEDAHVVAVDRTV
ncbi:ABC transporter ATP-binding protein [Natronococcus roseus]|uniref:ABC transporter ATP-binding protein n=1 Tax=Natronococcus roseus TaxID=1052014 RepID=UPI00374D1F5D